MAIALLPSQSDLDGHRANLVLLNSVLGEVRYVTSMATSWPGSPNPHRFSSRFRTKLYCNIGIGMVLFITIFFIILLWNALCFVVEKRWTTVRSIGKPRSSERRTRLQVERARGFEEAREDEEGLEVRHGEEVREVEEVHEDANVLDVQANWVEFEPWEDEVIWIFFSDDCFWWPCGTGRLPRRVGGGGPGTGQRTG